MKKINLQYYVITILLSFLFIFIQLYAISQDTTQSTSQMIVEEEAAWYMQPWAWMAGGALLLIILLSLFSGRKKVKPVSKTDRVIITKTVTRETDIED